MAGTLRYDERSPHALGRGCVKVGGYVQVEEADRLELGCGSGDKPSWDHSGDQCWGHCMP